MANQTENSFQKQEAISIGGRVSTAFKTSTKGEVDGCWPVTMRLDSALRVADNEPCMQVYGMACAPAYVLNCNAHLQLGSKAACHAIHCVPRLLATERLVRRAATQDI